MNPYEVAGCTVKRAAELRGMTRSSQRRAQLVRNIADYESGSVPAPREVIDGLAFRLGLDGDTLAKLWGYQPVPDVLVELSHCTMKYRETRRRLESLDMPEQSARAAMLFCDDTPVGQATRMMLEALADVLALYGLDKTPEQGDSINETC